MQRADLAAILKLEVPVIVRLGERKLRLSEVMALVPGAIIELPKSADAELELFINNKQVGFGTACKVAENFGLSITYIGDIRARIEAMAGAEGDAPGPASAAGARDTSTMPGTHGATGPADDPEKLAEAMLAGQ